jgi:hypothetical protein
MFSLSRKLSGYKLPAISKWHNVGIHWAEPLKMTIMSNLKDIKSEIEKYANDSNLTELQIVEKLEKHYFDKKVNENLKLYKKGKKKVSEITKELKISPRKFYAILEKKKIEHKKYKKEWFKIKRLTFSSFAKSETELKSKTRIECGI